MFGRIDGANQGVVNVARQVVLAPSDKAAMQLLQGLDSRAAEEPDFIGPKELKVLDRACFIRWGCDLASAAERYYGSNWIGK